MRVPQGAVPETRLLRAPIAGSAAGTLQPPGLRSTTARSSGAGAASSEWEAARVRQRLRRDRGGRRPAVAKVAAHREGAGRAGLQGLCFARGVCPQCRPSTALVVMRGRRQDPEDRVGALARGRGTVIVIQLGQYWLPELGIFAGQCLTPVIRHSHIVCPRFTSEKPCAVRLVLPLPGGHGARRHGVRLEEEDDGVDCPRGSCWGQDFRPWFSRWQPGGTD